MGSLPMTNAEFTLDRATYEDIDTLLDVYFHAFAADSLYPFLYPKVSWEDKIRFEASGPKRVFIEQPWTKLFKITEEKTGFDPLSPQFFTPLPDPAAIVDLGD
jgi:hypothetical protein